MSTKHFFHDADELVLDSLEGFTTTNPTLRFDKTNKAIFFLGHDPESTVTLISGGGAGHEPAHAGYVGEGLLTAAVSGSIFASPSVSQIVNIISNVGGRCGTILIIKNYTGDIFHFHLAAEKSRAKFGFPIAIIVVGDDVSVGREKSGKVGRRGLAGIVLVHKILGAMSKTPNASFDDLVKMGRRVASNLVTVGASLGHVHIPGREILSNHSTLKIDQVELGMGIHNESGCRLLQPQPDLPSLVHMMLDQLLNMQDSDRAFVDMHSAEEIVLLVNNLGSVSVLELGAITKHVKLALEFRGFKISRSLSGTFMTSLDGPGFSITLLKASSEMLRYIDAPTNATGWSVPSFPPSSWEDRTSPLVEFSNGLEEEYIFKESGELNIPAFKSKISQACINLITAEPQITYFDSVVGDGDCGITLARGAKAVLHFITSTHLSTNAGLTMMQLATVIENSMDGTSGAIYSIFMAALASAIRFKVSSDQPLDARAWGIAATLALSQLQLATPARQGDRTIMDALEPFIKSMASGDDIKKAVRIAKEGVEATKGMKASFGRAVYVEESAWNHVPDPGAVGILCLLEGFAGVSSSIA